MEYLLEDTVVNELVKYLESRGWEIDSFCTGRTRGVDVCAKREGKTLLVEAKGGKGNPKQHGVVRAMFDSGQIKDHLGKAIVKVLELKVENPEAFL